MAAIWPLDMPLADQPRHLPLPARQRARDPTPVRAPPGVRAAGRDDSPRANAMASAWVHRVLPGRRAPPGTPPPGSGLPRRAQRLLMMHGGAGRRSASRDGRPRRVGRRRAGPAPGPAPAARRRSRPARPRTAPRPIGSSARAAWRTAPRPPARPRRQGSPRSHAATPTPPLRVRLVPHVAAALARAPAFARRPVGRHAAARPAHRRM